MAPSAATDRDLLPGLDLTDPAREALDAARSGRSAPHLPALLSALTRLRAGSRGLVFVIDQLEEAVTQCTEDDRQGFLAPLEALLAQEPRLRVVTTVRSDTIGPECLDTLLLFVMLGAGGATRQAVRSSALDDRQLPVVEAFVEARLLVSDRGADGVVVFDIAHEALLRQWQPLAEHIMLPEEGLRRNTELAPLARAWLQSGRRPDYLITGARLAEALARPGRALDPDLSFSHEAEMSG